MFSIGHERHCIMRTNNMQTGGHFTYGVTRIRQEHTPWRCVIRPRTARAPARYSCPARNASTSIAGASTKSNSACTAAAYLAWRMSFVVAGASSLAWVG